jgi:hypothetical protein
VVNEFAAKIGVAKLAPHDLRRSCARLYRGAGGEIQFLLGHVSVQTRTVPRLHQPDFIGVNGRIGIGLGLGESSRLYGQISGVRL